MQNSPRKTRERKRWLSGWLRQHRKILSTDRDSQSD
jgi:hypothetical protein